MSMNNIQHEESKVEPQTLKIPIRLHQGTTGLKGLYVYIYTHPYIQE